MGGQGIANPLLLSVDLSLPVMRELGAAYIEETAEYIASSPQFIVNGFIRSGNSHALDNLPVNDDNDELVVHISDNEHDSDYKEESQDEASDEEKDSTKCIGDDSTTEDDLDSHEYQYIHHPDVIIVY